MRKSDIMALAFAAAVAGLFPFGCYLLLAILSGDPGGILRFAVIPVAGFLSAGAIAGFLLLPLTIWLRRALKRNARLNAALSGVWLTVLGVAACIVTLVSGVLSSCESMPRNWLLALLISLSRLDSYSALIRTSRSTASADSRAWT